MLVLVWADLLYIVVGACILGCGWFGFTLVQNTRAAQMAFFLDQGVTGRVLIDNARLCLALVVVLFVTALLAVSLRFCLA